MPEVIGANRTRVDLDPSAAVTTPAGTQAGDLLLAINGCDTDGAVGNLGLPAGFTELDNHDAGNQPVQRVGYLVLAGSPNASYTFSTDDNTEGDCTLVTIRDFDAAGPFPGGLVIEGANAPGSTNHVASSVTGIDGGLLIAGFARDRENNLANYNGAPTGMALVIATPNDNWYIQAVYEQDLTADGATGTRTATTTVSTLWRGETDWLLVVAPAAGDEASGGSETTITVTADGAGVKAIASGTEAGVDVASEGGGAAARAGGSAATVAVTAAGAGTAARSGGAEATVTVTATGGGMVPGEQLVNLDFVALAPVFAHGSPTAPEFRPRVATSPELGHGDAGEPEFVARTAGEPVTAHGDPTPPKFKPRTALAPAFAHGDPGEPTT